MATNLVNLDALIKRDDFLVAGEAQVSGARSDTVKVNDLEKGSFFLNSLRKPDFQRETANWSPQKIYDFVKTFLDGDLIPAVIVWSAGGSNVFVIDGAHRLSALIAWVHDDYGDGDLSLDFFHNDIPPEQKAAAIKTRILINKTIGSYKEHKAAVTHAESKQELRDRAVKLGSFAVDLQWVPTSSSKKAEAAFFKINQAATPIDPTELRILNARFTPTAITSRVIVRNATGHKYWGNFTPPRKKEIEEIGKDIYKNLFQPPLQTPIKTLDLPVAGRGYSGQTLPLIFDLVNIANKQQVVEAAKKPQLLNDKLNDEDGSETVKTLSNTQALVRRITGLHPSSLGLHPAVYFYSATGRYQPTAFLAMSSLLMEFESKSFFKEFTNARARLESFLIKHKDYINQLTRKFGSGIKSYSQVKNLYSLLLDEIISGSTDDAINNKLGSHDVFKFLAQFEEKDGGEGQKFSEAIKSHAFLKAALASEIHCKVCNGLMHFNSIQIDHIEKKADGGLAVSKNAQLTHPYCNSTVKQ